MDPSVLEEISLRYFLAVVRTGSVTSAADGLGVAASVVSRQVARLEKALDTLLFVRQARGMKLNAAGELLAAHAMRSHRSTERILGEIQALKGMRSGHIRLVCSLGLSANFVPSLIHEFRKEHHGVRFSVDSCSASLMAARMTNGEADIGLSIGMTSSRGVVVEARVPAPIYAIMSPTHALAGKKSLSLKQLVAQPIVLQGAESIVRQLIDVSMSRQQLHCEAVCTSKSVDVLIGLARAGEAIAFSGELAVRGLVQHGELVAVPLVDREMHERHVEILTVAGKTQSTECRAFIDFAADRLAR